MEEQWKEIIGYDNYLVSNQGRIQNKTTKRILKAGNDGKGYLYVNLYKKDEKLKSFKIHRLVGAGFIENFDALLDIDHIDRCKTNNHINNLRNVSHSENCKNKNKKANCSSIYKGVTFFKRDENWKAETRLNGKHIFLGYFATEIEASNKYQIWNAEHNFIV